MKSTILSLAAILFVFPIVASAENIHGVDVPNECLASLRVKPNAFISNLSGFPSWKPLERYRCETIEEVRARLFINGIAKQTSEIKFMMGGIQSLIDELEQKKSEIESDLARSRPSTDVAGDILSDVIWIKVGVIQTVIGCAGGQLGCAISTLASMAAIMSMSESISKGNDAVANTRKLKDRLKETNDKLKKAKSDFGLLENFSSEKMKEGVINATKDFVEMCRLIKLNCN